MSPDDPDGPTEDGGGAQTRASLSAIDTAIRFAPGDTIAGRYKIARLIAHGGMGDVYEATDLDLRSQIALKTIRGAASGARVERFRRELFLARKVTHPNVCRVFDLGRHSVNGVGDVAFITMELLRGETLADRLKATGRMATGEALVVIRQVAAAIDAAHAVGVVHRDLKPANVMLVPAEGQPRLRAIVTDFGVAHAAGDPFADVSIAGELVGSPAYMAPEQIEGEETTPRTDIYSLGIMIYEMVTGVRPFTGETSMSAAVKRLTTGPARPTAHHADLAPVWEAAILRCIEVDPIARFASGADLVEALEGATTSPVSRVALDETAVTGAVTAVRPVAPTSAAAPPVVPASPRSRRGWWLVGVLVGALGATAALLALRERGRAPVATGPVVSAGSAAPVPPAPAPPAASIAVLPFLDASPGKDQEYFADGLTEELMVLLARVPGVRVIGRTSSFALKGSTDDAATLGRKLGVAKLLEGRVAKIGERLRITARLVNAADGFQLWSESYDRDARDVFATQDEIAGAVARALERELAPPTPSVAAHIPAPAAYDQLLRGRMLIARDTQDDLAAAAKAFQAAIDLDPAYAAAYASLARAEYGLRDFAPTAEASRAAVTRALALADQALALGPDVAEVHATRGFLFLNITWDWDAARAAFKRALELAPNAPATLQHYAFLLDLLGEIDEEVAVMRRTVELDPLSASAWNSFALVELSRGHYAEARTMVARALEIHPDSNMAGNSLASIQLMERQPEAAIASAAPLPPLYRLMIVAMAEHTRGNEAASKRALDELVRTLPHTAAYQIASAHAWRGEADKAFEWLDNALADRDGGLASIRTDPFLASLRADPRYRAFLAKLRLEP